MDDRVQRTSVSNHLAICSEELGVKHRPSARTAAIPLPLRKLVNAHEKWRLENCLNLLPSENILSPAVRQMLSSDLSSRYTSPDRFYMGTRYIDQIQTETENLAKDVFGAKYADVRPISGHSADMIVLTALANRGDKVMVVGEAYGGYPGISQDGYPKIHGLEVHEFPFNKRIFNIDAGPAATAIERERPRLVVFGASMILFPHPVRALADICHQVGASIVFDGSHVLGLIAGGQFQDPLREGADVLIGSTHKSFFGPQGGIVLSNGDEEQLRNAVHPAIVDNAHWNRIAALYVALHEIRKFGKRYAEQVVRNSRALAKALDEHGVRLIGKDQGFTQSHQVIVDVPTEEEGRRLAQRLEEANLIVDVGIRIGSSEETRRGMLEPQMNEIGELIARVWISNEDPKKVRKEVLRLRRDFPSIRYA
jgi:glycine hydroxymethyltransferase